MIPIKLEFHGIGSYIEKTEIDFTQLENVYLICGSTGSGKTTILDAITYALYGESSGGERSVPVSRYLPDGMTAYSRFTFALGDKQYRFTRTYTPNKKNVYSPSASCEVLDGEKESGEQWKPCVESTRISDISDKAKELLRLTADQFRQVVILPQGKFERLLTSPSKEKEQILSTLFDAAIYTSVTDKLREQANEKKQLLEKQKTELAAILAAAEFADIAQAETALSELEEKMPSLSEALSAAEKAKSAAAEEYSRAAVIAERFEEYDRAKENYLKLQSRREEFLALEADEKRLTAHSFVLGAYDSYISARDEKLRRSNELNICIDGEKNAFDKMTAARKDYSDHILAAEENKSDSRELVRLTGLIPVYESIIPLKNRADKLLTEGKQLNKKAADAVNRYKAARERLAALTEEAAGYEESAARLNILTERKIVLENARALSAESEVCARKKQELEWKLFSAKKQLSDIEQNISVLEQKHEELEKMRLEGLSRILAEGLSEGTPCPVCGSVHHPNLCGGDGTGGGIGEEDVKSSAQDLLRAKEERSRLSAFILSCSEKIEDEERRLREYGERISETGYTAEEYEKTAVLLKIAADADAALKRLNNDIKQCRIEADSLSAESEKLSSMLTEARVEYTGALSEYKSALSQSDSTVPDMAALRTRIAYLADKTDGYSRRGDMLARLASESEAAYERAKTMRESAENEEKRCAEAEIAAYERAAKQLAEKGLPAPEDFVPDRNGVSGLEKLRALCERNRQECSAAEREKSVLEAALGNTVRPDMAALKAALEASDKAYNEAAVALRIGEDRLKALRNTVTLYREKQEKLSADTECYNRRSEFAAVMTGSKDISYTRYVLGVMLDLVIEEANAMLAEKLGGQFRLYRKTDGFKRNTANGLDLEAENSLGERSAAPSDTPSEAKRTAVYDVKQLSGGEKFLLSLVLAVSLSRTVQTHFGGVPIDAMFIDEGFGSLDPASLKDAVNVVYSIRDSRMVGIISHVEALKEEITSGLEITKGENGSSVTVR
ncbi:MAG: AAA family ATPase [Huintestinicola sp.]